MNDNEAYLLWHMDRVRQTESGLYETARDTEDGLVWAPATDDESVTLERVKACPTISIRDKS